MDKDTNSITSMDKTKKKIKLIGNVSNVILIIVSVIIIIAAAAAAFCGTMMFTISRTMTDEEMISFFSDIVNQKNISLSSADKEEMKNGLIESIDNLNSGGLLHLEYNGSGDIKMSELYSFFFFGFAIMCVILFIFVRVIRSMMKTLSKGDRPFTFKAAKKLRRLSFAMLLITLVNPLTGIMLFVATLIFSYLFEYGAYLQEKADETNRIQEEMIMSFAEVTENKSEQTGKHVRRVAEYSGIIAEEMGLDEEQVSKLRLASTMHDIGKLLIPAEILEKPARLTDDEFAVIKKHPAYGGKLLDNVEGDVMGLARTIALDHHERIDGRGYPDGKSGNYISVEGRIVAVADVYDALTSKRSYKEPWDHQKAYEEILKGSGTQFDEKVVDAFKRRYDDINALRQQYADAV